MLENWLQKHKDAFDMVLDSESDIYSIGVSEQLESENLQLTMDLVYQNGDYEMYIIAQHEDKEKAFDSVRQLTSLIDEDVSENMHTSDRIDWVEITFKTTEEKIRNL